MSDTELPKQELLLKLLKMTTSDNDPEALSALRKANTLLKSAGWDWDMLIHSKIRIIEDPFKNLGTPPGGRTNGTSAPAYAAPASTPYSPPGSTPPRPATTKTTWPLGINPNRFAGWCYCCGQEVVANAGVIFKPYQYHSHAVDDWKVACITCNTSATVLAHPASRRRSYTSKGKIKPSVSDLS